MKKVIRDGKVAIIYHPSFGAGWYTWNEDYKEMMYHPQLVQKILDDEQKDLTEEWVKAVLGIDSEKHLYCGAAGELKIEWLPIGTAFRISEYDGFESVITKLELPEIA
jgi:hypothetical protein